MITAFVTYFRKLSPDHKRELANACDTSVEYLAKQVSLIAKGRDNSLFKPAMCLAIEIYSNGEVTRKDLRPNDWDAIWLELRPEYKITHMANKEHVQKVTV